MKSAVELFFLLNDCLLAGLNVHLNGKNRDRYSTTFEAFRTQLTFNPKQLPCPLAETTVQRIGNLTVSICPH